MAAKAEINPDKAASMSLVMTAYGMAQFPPSAGRAGAVFKNNASLAAMLAVRVI